jgi:Fic family protein
MQEILQRITEKKELLDSLRPLPKELEKNLYEWFRVTLTYTSNSIEGNTLTLGETAQIVEKNLTVSGKSIVEHLEAINHAKAVDFIQNLAKKTKRSDLKIDDISEIHKILLYNINTDWAGVFRETPVRIVGSQVTRPNYIKVPELMNSFIEHVKNSQDHIAKIAADAHLQFVFIHPFVDGNGRTARLLLNLLLLQENYPLTYIRSEDREKYINSIEKALLKEDKTAFYELVFESIEHSLDEYITAARESKK